jgi:hypothetical protein
MVKRKRRKEDVPQNPTKVKIQQVGLEIGGELQINM